MVGPRLHWGGGGGGDSSHKLAKTSAGSTERRRERGASSPLEGCLGPEEGVDDGGLDKHLRPGNTEERVLIRHNSIWSQITCEEEKVTRDSEVPLGPGA